MAKGWLEPFFSFYGGKWRAALRYPSPEHHLIIEPFAGSAGYAVRHPTRDVLLCDLDERVVGTWQYLINVSKSEILKLPLEFDDVRDLNIPQEAQWLIGWWLNKGTAWPRYRPAQWMRNPLPGRLNTFWGEGIRQRIASQVEQIRHWRVVHGSYEDMPDTVATWFIDPPYTGPPGKHYAFGADGINYRELATWCQSRQGQTIVCENVGADWLPFEPFMSAKATAGRGRVEVSNEAIWISNRGSEEPTSG